MNIKNINKPQHTPPTLDQQLHKVAEMYEQQFLQEMMNAMKKTVDHSGITQPSMAEKIYKDELYTQYAEKWVENGGNGLADLIYKELKEKILPSQHSRYVASPVPSKKEKK
jgi:Rod binding domain-containing protein